MNYEYPAISQPTASIEDWFTTETYRSPFGYINDPEDIERMKTHEGYILANQGDNHGLQKTPCPESSDACSGQDAEAKEVKKRGRPKK